MTRRAASASHDEQGSILLEVLVAAALITLIVTLAFQVSADSVVRHRKLEARRHALMVARSQLAAVGAATPLAPGAVQGVDGDDIWTIETQPCGAPGDHGVGALYCVTVAVGGAEGGPPLVVLRSQRIAPTIS